MLKFLAFAVIIGVSIFLVGGIVFNHKRYLKKGTLIILVICAGAFTFLMRSVHSNQPLVAVPVYAQNVPDVKHAPYVVQTSSRAYYVTTYKESNQVISLLDYYFFDTKWEHGKSALQLDRKVLGDIRIYKR